MKVIVAGLPKTGTKSMNAALTHLGYKVYDVIQNIVLLEEDYVKIFHSGWTTADFVRMYKDVDATMDIPACYFWEEIHKAHPEAMVILTVRDSEEVWLESLKNHVAAEDAMLVFRFLHVFSPTVRRVLRDIVEVQWRVVLGVERTWGWGLSTKTHLNGPVLKLKYRAHNAYVLENAPPKKLLVYNCKQGWEPLCKFLALPIPDVPFPHENKRGVFAAEAINSSPLMRSIWREVKIVATALVSSVAFAGYLLYKGRSVHGRLSIV